MNIILGAPYNKIIDDAVKKGQAGTKAEVIRQALKLYQRYFEDEETLVARAVEREMALFREGKIKGMPFEDFMKKYENK
ncbi:MAG: type II toxin-antitoxin system ParD family antitoxin [Candidatus Micrarchaeia archaeon]|jgi:Arc/MetJ-type ribon-helix-helix transcriptional regulator